MLPVGGTSNSPEAVHCHLKDQSQWSLQAHLKRFKYLRVSEADVINEKEKKKKRVCKRVKKKAKTNVKLHIE